MSGNLVSGLAKEIMRNAKLLKVYEELGPPGGFAAAAIRADIKRGERALETGDIVEMVGACRSLQSNTL